MNRRAMLWAALIVFLAVLGVGTINNQLRLNKANATLAAQAMNGQRALTRTCRLVPIGHKLYVWAQADPTSKITVADVALVQSTAAQACGAQP